MRLAGVSQPLAIALAAATAALIALLSLLRGDSRIVAAIPEWLSPIGHFLLYGVLAVVCVRALQFAGLAMPVTVIGGVALAAGFGAAMELAQRYRPGRYARGMDVLIDAGGAALGGALCLAV